MRKKIVIFILLCIIIVIPILLAVYKDYGRKQAYKYANYFVEFTHKPTYMSQPVITEDVSVEKIIKQTPFELVFLINWGDNERAYVSIKNLMVKEHHTTEVQVLDKSKHFMIYQ
jgi:hypothetical protein